MAFQSSIEIFFGEPLKSLSDKGDWNSTGSLDFLNAAFARVQNAAEQNGEGDGQSSRKGIGRSAHWQPLKRQKSINPKKLDEFLGNYDIGVFF